MRSEDTTLSVIGREVVITSTCSCLGGSLLYPIRYDFTDMLRSR